MRRMDEWKKVLVLPETKIQNAIEIIDRCCLQIAIVVDSDGRLLGTVTDEDICRGILKGIPLNDPVERIMNPHPVTIPAITDKKSILPILRANKLRHLPVVDDAGHIIGIERLDDLIESPKNENWVVVMAGGMGKRLRPLTKDCPKPMLQVGDKPVLETILNQFMSQGFYKFCFCVHYKSEKIRDYFQDGSKWGAEIHYIDEEKPMGTVGSLSLFPFQTDRPILIINGDILTKVSFNQLIDFHFRHQALATVAVATYDYQVPYGVVKANKDRLIGFEEKPVYANFVNAFTY